MPRFFGTTCRGRSCARSCRKPDSSKFRNWNDFLAVLATLAFLAPLLGLLGTVAGMIDAFGDDRFARRLRHGHRTFRRRLQKLAYDGGRSGRRDADFCCLQLSFAAGEHDAARNGARRN